MQGGVHQQIYLPLFVALLWCLLWLWPNLHLFNRPHANVPFYDFMYQGHKTGYYLQDTSINVIIMVKDMSEHPRL